MTPIISLVCAACLLPRVTRGALRAVVVLLAAVAALAGAVTASAEDHHPPIATLVKNLDQPSGPDIRIVLSKSQDGLMQGFRTGPHQGGYELEGIWLYVRDTHESRYMTINADLYRGPGLGGKVATLTRGQLNDYAHNEWKAPANTYLEPNTNYYFMLDCVSGCANDNVAQFGTTYSAGEDGGDEPGWSIHDRMLFRRPGENWIYENDEALRIRVRGRPSPYRAYRTEIVSTPRDGSTYHHGENIDVALTFNAAVYVPPSGSIIAIRVGDTADGSNYRAAEYHSGSQTNRLVYRYQVQLADADTDGISVDVGGPNSGFGGTVPTIVASFGLLPVIDYYPGLADDHHHRVDGSFHVHDVAGLRGTVVPAAATGGFSLGVKADGLLLRATSEAAPGLAATTADVNRVRLGLEGAYALALGADAWLTPSVEVGVRRDDGTAETGFGMDVGGGLRYTHPRLGLSLGLKGRALVMHETAELAEWGASGWLAWDPNPASELGPALSVSPSFGARSEGGAAELWSRETLPGLAGDPTGTNGAGRIDGKFGYGMPLAGGVGVPWAGIGLSEREREYRVGYAFQAGTPSATDLRIELVAARREPTAAVAEHTLSVQSTVSW